MKDMLRVDIQVDEKQYREATGLVRFDEDPHAHFFAAIDAKLGSLQDEVNDAVRAVLARVSNQITWEVTVTPYQTPMTDRGRYERRENGLAQIGVSKGKRRRR